MYTFRVLLLEVEEIFVGAKVYKVINGETHYNKVYTVRQVSKTGRIRLESELWVADYGWFTRGEVAIFNPSQVEIARQRPERAKIFTGLDKKGKGLSG